MQDKPDYLAHGEKQWLEIGMVLVTRPSLLLLDEAVGNCYLGREVDAVDQA